MLLQNCKVVCFLEKDIFRINYNHFNFTFNRSCKHVEYECTKIHSLLICPGSPYRDLISDAILRLQEEQILQMLYNKWWKEDRGGGMCDAIDDKVKKDANALTIGNVGGVFVVLAVGLMLSPFVAIIEFVWKNRREKTKTHPITSDNRVRCLQCNADRRLESSAPVVDRKFTSAAWIIRVHSTWCSFQLKCPSSTKPSVHSECRFQTSFCIALYLRKQIH